jgi:16S rRNA (uracil1498-N3)-methyltransferase
MRRFFVDPGILGQSSAVIRGELCNHIATVLRLKTGDAILLADGRGVEARARIAAVEKDGISVEIEPPGMDVPAGGDFCITLYQGLPKGEKLDLILQKCTELGISRIVPFNAERSVARLADERLAKRVQRWERIAMEASRQSGRSRIPAIGFAPDLRTALERDNSTLRLLLWEGEEEQGLRSVLERSGKPASVSIIIGPEGGLSKGEAAAAAAAGFTPVNLGRRILRTETAGLAVTAILQYLWGDLG